MPDAMPQLQTPPDTGGLYDHESDSDLQLGGRRRVADWGADDLFHQTPRRRRSAKALAARERRVSGPALPAPRHDRAAVPAPRPATPATVTRIEDAPSYFPGDTSVEPFEARAAVAQTAGRRTVTITGRPEPKVARSHPERRRPVRTAHERIVGHRPDRLAAWAVGLGMLLSLIAVGTSDAAPL